MKTVRRRCSACGRRRVGAFWHTDYKGTTHMGSSNPPTLTMGSDPQFWPTYHGWLCREHDFFTSATERTEEA